MSYASLYNLLNNCEETDLVVLGAHKEPLPHWTANTLRRSQSMIASFRNILWPTTYIWCLSTRLEGQKILNGCARVLTSDQKEIERLEDQHHLFDLIFDERLVIPPGYSLPRRGNVLDCGFGGGSWAVEVAENYPECEVLVQEALARQCN